jgi:hypothetical protein
MNCPNYQGCGNTLCSLNSGCMDHEYWAQYWKNKGKADGLTKAAVGKQIQIATQVLVKPILCCYCRKEIIFKSHLTREHLIPVSMGGTNKKINKQPCCKSCNQDRGNKPLAIWMVECQQKYDTLPKGMIKDIYANRIEQCRYWISYIIQEGKNLYK